LIRFVFLQFIFFVVNVRMTIVDNFVNI
jgi:hypothetical protein